MAKEIERKFLVTSKDFQQGAIATYFHQGYLSLDPARSVRVRIEGDHAKITIKGKTEGFSRDEFEYMIPKEEASYMLNKMCIQPTIEKTRFRVQVGEHIWEIDEFKGQNEGLIMAEIELATEDTPFSSPSWLGKEVTGNPQYYNLSLVNYPYKDWTKEDE